jgi:hypothetical protein
MHSACITRSCLHHSYLLFMQSSFMDDFFDMGDFDMGFGGFGSSCTQINDPDDYPAYRALWSCGLRVRGAAVCVPGEGWRVAPHDSVNGCYIDIARLGSQQMAQWE